MRPNFLMDTMEARLEMAAKGYTANIHYFGADSITVTYRKMQLNG